MMLFTRWLSGEYDPLRPVRGWIGTKNKKLDYLIISCYAVLLFTRRQEPEEERIVGTP